MPLDCPPAPTTLATDLGSRLLIAPLAGARNLSGYRGVYPHKSGWRAVVKWGGNERRDPVTGRRTGGKLLHGPVVPLPQQAAVQLAAWLRDRLGPRWADLVRRGGRRLWRKHAPWRAERREDGAWTLSVWVRGVEEEARDQAGALLTFLSWSDAANAVPGYMRRAHGDDWWGMLWR